MATKMARRTSGSAAKGPPGGRAILTLSAAREYLRCAGKTLHDDVGPLLSAAGFRLQLLAMDHPAAAGQAKEVAATLDQAMEIIRALSQRLSPSPFAAAVIHEPKPLARRAKKRNVRS